LKTINIDSDLHKFFENPVYDNKDIYADEEDHQTSSSDKHSQNRRRQK